MGPVSIGTRLGRIARAAAGSAALVAWVALARPHPAGVSLGALVAAVGEALRFWAAGHRDGPDALPSGGPYRFTRHPAFLGDLAVFAGLTIAAPLPGPAAWIAPAAGLAAMLAYFRLWKERRDARRLRALHGPAFERYRESTPALLPRPGLPPRSAASPGWSSDRLVRSGEPWRLVVLVVTALTLLWKAYRPGP